MFYCRNNIFIYLVIFVCVCAGQWELLHICGELFLIEEDKIISFKFG